MKRDTPWLKYLKESGTRSQHIQSEIPLATFDNARTSFEVFARYLGLCFALGLLGWAAWTLISFVDISPELSDSGFYLLMHRESEQILSLNTFFGVLLKTFIGEPSVQITRYIHFALLFLGPAGFVWAASVISPTYQDLKLRLTLSIASGCAGWAYFKWMLLDPNYNSLTIFFFFASITALWVFLERLRVPELTSFNLKWPSTLAGAALFAFGLSKASSALLIIVFFTATSYCINLPAKPRTFEENQYWMDVFCLMGLCRNRRSSHLGLDTGGISCGSDA